ncbi:hypothetical protein IQ279_08240 [Streptomyces verrucosisporus]|uniref:hypothetical protein n=1 Tax=Streptomyces verrucosisporus TaxID=1695161 RepID=UPI0019CFD0EA|nr:hypothetical protein [Streptomyces verrucosisporus]MBN3929629.1 hypothetical protein [Streptomyces verrucosisporus]
MGSLIGKRSVRAGLLVSATLAAVILPAGQANAEISYTDSQCSSSTRCFAIFFNSMQSIGIFRSACFITNKSEYSHLGYDYAQYQVRYQFNYGYGFGWDGQLPNASACVGTDPGSGWSVKNNAAGASNSDSVSHRVYYNTGYAGVYQTIETDHNENLISSLKNDNASSKRL